MGVLLGKVLEGFFLLTPKKQSRRYDGVESKLANGFTQERILEEVCMAAILTEHQESAEREQSSVAVTQKKVYKANEKWSYLFIKRFFDILLSFGVGVVLLLPMAIVALVIKLDSPGPALYKQERLSKNGKPFQIYKFRSMYVDAEKNGPQWAKWADPRCTKVGKVIRRWHIDELPQLINVLKGEMRIVGPRPEREYFYQEFEKDIPEYRVRLLVDQGLTCIGQVNGCYDLTPQERLAYDIEYIEKQSVWTDLKCILKTFSVIVNHRGAR